MPYLLLSLGFLSLSIALASQPGKTLTWREDFSAYEEGSDGSPRWRPAAGVWRIRHGEYVQEQPLFTETLTFLAEPVFSDFDFSVRFRIRNLGAGVRAAGMVFRAESTREFYYVHFDSRNTQVILVRCSRTKPWNEIRRVRNIPIVPERWHTGRVVAEGTHFRVYLDDRLILEAEEATHPVGKIGLRVGQGVVHFDDLRLTGTSTSLRREWENLPVPTPEMDREARKAEHIERLLAVQGQGYFPVLIRLRNGELAAVVRGGAPHVGVGGRLDLIKSADGGRTWSAPQTVAALPPDSRNPAFGQAPDGRLILAFALTGPYEKGRFTAATRRYTVWLTTSEDNGTTWTKPHQLEVAPLTYGSPYGKIVSLPDDTLLMNVYEWEEAGKYAAYLYRSRDQGRTWGEPTLIAEGYNETALLPLPDGRLLAFLRDGGGIHQAESRDGGRTWSKPKRILDRGRHPADVIRLQSGHLLLTAGHRILPFGVLALLSRDGGRTWAWEQRVLLEWQSGNTDCGYPSSVQLDDGTIVTMCYGVTHGAYPDLRQYALCVRYREETLWPQ
ncbi:MAG TPA: DUF1080 domain-containing protein [Armatimonadetes bacterium]|nr:DUF1080 domain-containing protein [Armatimonadota bacterium]